MYNILQNKKENTKKNKSTRDKQMLINKVISVL